MVHHCVADFEKLELLKKVDSELNLVARRAILVQKGQVIGPVLVCKQANTGSAVGTPLNLFFY